LARTYHQDKKEFDLNSSLVDILTAYNNNIHATTKVAPSIAFKLDPEKENDKQLLTWIHENTRKFFLNKLNIILIKEYYYIIIY